MLVEGNPVCGVPTSKELEVKRREKHGISFGTACDIFRT